MKTPTDMAFSLMGFFSSNAKRIFIALFLLSLGFNVIQQLDIRGLRTANTELQAEVSSYKHLFDSTEMEAHELQKINTQLKKRNKHVPPIVVDRWAKSIQESSQFYDLNVDILMRLYRIESAQVHYSTEGFITVSNKNAGGLGQIMRFWYKQCPHSSRPKDLDNANVNIMCTAYILRHYLNENDQNLFLALTAYNSGPNGVRLMKRGRDITDGYARKILRVRV